MNATISYGVSEVCDYLEHVVTYQFQAIWYWYWCDYKLYFQYGVSFLITEVKFVGILRKEDVLWKILIIS